MTSTGFHETVLLLRPLPARTPTAWNQDRIQSWVIGAGVVIAVLLSAAAYF
jgi:hypothetical protein